MRQRVLITGGAHRLGALLCSPVRPSGLGGLVPLPAQRRRQQKPCAPSLRAQGHAAQAIAADLGRRRPAASTWWRTSRQRSGPLHCLVNNASSFEPDSGDAMDVADARQQIEVNLLAPLALASLMAQTPMDAAHRCAQRDSCAGPKGFQPQPRLLFLHREQARAGARRRLASAGAGTCHSGVWRGAGADVFERPPNPGQL